jgi:hypothetical protein
MGSDDMTTDSNKLSPVVDTSTDGQGHRISCLKTTDGHIFKILEEDLNAIRTWLGVDCWFEVHTTRAKSEVFAINGKGGYHLARLLLEPEVGKRVTFLDGDVFNIVRDNLTVVGLRAVA